MVGHDACSYFHVGLPPFFDGAMPCSHTHAEGTISVHTHFFVEKNETEGHQLSVVLLLWHHNIPQPNRGTDHMPSPTGLIVGVHCPKSYILTIHILTKCCTLSTTPPFTSYVPNHARTLLRFQQVRAIPSMHHGLKSCMHTTCFATNSLAVLFSYTNNIVGD